MWQQQLLPMHCGGGGGGATTVCYIPSVKSAARCPSEEIPGNFYSFALIMSLVKLRSWISCNTPFYSQCLLRDYTAYHRRYLCKSHEQVQSDWRATNQSTHTLSWRAVEVIVLSEFLISWWADFLGQMRNRMSWFFLPLRTLESNICLPISLVAVDCAHHIGWGWWLVFMELFSRRELKFKILPTPFNIYYLQWCWIAF